jgi:hypothetical protein
MVRLLLTSVAALAACTPSRQESAMHNQSPDPGIAAQGSSAAEGGANPGRRSQKEPGAGNAGSAAMGPIPEPISVADHPLPPPAADSAEAAEGRRILSTAFVRVGPGGHLTVELRDGRVLVLRDVVMRRKDYCGLLEPPGPASRRYCGGYAEVATARPSG